MNKHGVHLLRFKVEDKWGIHITATSDHVVCITTINEHVLVAYLMHTVADILPVFTDDPSSWLQVTLHYNFGPHTMAPLPFKCRSINDARRSGWGVSWSHRGWLKKWFKVYWKQCRNILNEEDSLNINNDTIIHIILLIVLVIRYRQITNINDRTSKWIFMVSLCQPWGYHPPKLPVWFWEKHIYILYIYCTSFSWESFDLIFDPFQQIAARSFVGWMNGLNKKYQESLPFPAWRFVRFGWWERVTCRHIPKLSKFPLLIILTYTDSIWQLKYAEMRLSVVDFGDPHV